MRGRATGIYAIAICVTLVRGHITTLHSPNQLHPVHSLYVKPSIDGTTGDLYFAATEESGAKTQWLTDQPIFQPSLLPVAASKPQTTFPLAYSPYTSHDEGQLQQKRAVLTNSVQYAYALPVSADRTMAYPYAIHASTSAAQTPASETSPTHSCPEGKVKGYPCHPFQYFYPHMMTAYTNAKTILKESGMKDDTAGAIVSQATPLWSPYPYPMYVTVDPSAWLQAQTPTTTPSTTSTETDKNE